MIAAVQFSDVASTLIVEQVIRPATHAAIETRIHEISLQELVLSPLDEMEQVIDAIENDLVREEARKLLASMGLSTEAIENTTEDALLSMSSTVVDTVLYGAVREILSTLLCLICFVALSLLLRPVIWMIDTAFQLPLLRQANQFCGLVLGGIKGIIIVLVAVWALRHLGLWISGDVIENSMLLRLFSQTLDSCGLAPLPETTAS